MVSFDTLFMASVSLIGFISLFIIFRYRTIDIYVDNKKNALRLLLKDEIQINPKITVYIQSLGKNQEETKILIDSVNNSKKEPIEIFNKQIKDFREKRIITIILGLITISLWTCLSILLLYDILSEKKSILFILYLFFTLFFIFFELCKGFEE